jgi:tetratricopeptide (TPR) repeat protein/nucleoside phosphorylase
MEIRERRAMETSPQSFDVCVVCALPEEARAFLENLQQNCEGAFEEHVSSRYHYSYRFATIKNSKGELLNLHISWLPRYGPQEMTLHLSRVLEECQPRIAIMTGICAGDARQVQLGDLVVAERTFTYDNGKFTLDEQGRSVHLHDTLTYQLDANILQFLGLFDDWMPLVADLETLPPMLDQRKTVCHIKAMASGNAVRADNPFQDVQAPVRGTVAIDMEGAAFGLVMSRHPLTRWLIVKGVCDYADRTKNDTYHDYAARASASYALRFIQAYVTNERLPRPDEPSPSSRAGPSSVWNVPYLRNPHFTGREELLNQLEQRLSLVDQGDSGIARRAVLTQTQAIKGLGGIGKTQIAVEYAYRSRDLGRYTYTLWVNAASEETLITGFTTLAELLPEFPAKDETDQHKLVTEIKRWLEQCTHSWLLIFDNVDTDDCLSQLTNYFPQQGKGSILLTTRSQAVGSLGPLVVSINVEEMDRWEGTLFLLRRTQLFKHASIEDASNEEVDMVNAARGIVDALESFPLALEQAGAYIEETGSNLTDYLQIYQDHRKYLLAKRGHQITNYPDTVATTWSLSFQKVEQTNPAAAELLRLCAFLAPDKIPEELIRDSSAQWDSPLRQAVADLFSFNQMIVELLKFSLIKRLAEDHVLSIHRLVQAVQMDMMEPAVQRQWAERVVRAVNDVFPDNPHDIATWPQCLRYLDQVQACNTLIAQYVLPLIEAANLLNRTGFYLAQHALYAIAEPLLKRALLIREQQLGAEHPATALSLSDLGALYQDQRKYTEAEPLLKRALLIREQQLGAEHPATAQSLNTLAALYQDQGKYTEAEPLLKRALMTHKQQLGTERPSTAQSLHNLAMLYKAQGKYTEAEPLLKRALLIREQQLGAEHPATAQSLNDLGMLYRSQGKYTEAELLLKRALLIREQQLGAEHPAIAQSLNTLAMFYRSQGKYTEAEPLLKRALAIYEQQSGVMHLDTATGLCSLAVLYRDQRKYTEAEPLLKRALAIYEQQLGAEHPDTATLLRILALLYQKQGKFAEAELLLKRALAIYGQQPEAMHADMALSLNNLAVLYQNQGKFAEAEPWSQRALHIYKQMLGPEHSDTQQARRNHAILLRALGRDDEAKQLEEGS